MDVDETRRALHVLAEQAVNGEYDTDAADYAERMADLFLALDGWLKSGGALPRPWR